MTRLVILVPAAGASRRMGGRDKLLEHVDGRPLLRRQAERAIATGTQVVVLLPARDHPRAAALGGLGLRRQPVPDAAEGMGATLRAGIKTLPPGTRGVMVLPADMPDLETDDLVAVIARFLAEGAAVPVRAAGEDGRAGHPVLFPEACFDALSGLSGDVGARPVLEAWPGPVPTVPRPGSRALTDLDTPEAWAAWRAGQA